MKLFLSLLVIGLSAAGLFLLLKPSKPRSPRRTALPPKPQTPSPQIQAPAVPKSLPASPEKNSPEKIQQQVQKFAQRFPRQTAQVLQAWIKNKK